MNIRVSQKDIVVGLVAAVVGATVSSTMLPADTYGYITSDPVPHRVREVNGTVNRDADTELREQQRRVTRLQKLREEEVLHGSAEDLAPEADAMTYYQAYLYCRRLGFTRSRFHSCIEAVLETGTYENLF